MPHRRSRAVSITVTPAGIRPFRTRATLAYNSRRANAAEGFELSTTRFANLLMAGDFWSKRVWLHQLEQFDDSSTVLRKAYESTPVLETVWRRPTIRRDVVTRLPSSDKVAGFSRSTSFDAR